jgi:hypothetical protein
VHTKLAGDKTRRQQQPVDKTDYYSHKSVTVDRLDGPSLEAVSTVESDSGRNFSTIDLAGYETHDSFVALYTDPKDDSELLIDLSNVIYKSSPRAQLLVTAMVAQGSWEGYYEFQRNVAPLHYPIEETDNNIFEFQTRDDKTVDMLQQLLFLRSTDEQSAEAMKQGVGESYLMALPRLEVSGDPSRVLIGARSLIRYGFGVAPRAMSGGSYHVRKVEVFPNNFNVIIELIDERYLPADYQIFTFSCLLLPEKPMVPRAFDDRLPYFAVDYTDRGVHKPQTEGLLEDLEHAEEGFTVSDHVDTHVSVIYRYNLTALPNEQIRIYVDPTVPERWQESFREGIEAWNDGFALVGRPRTMRAVLPTDDDWPADYNPGDIRFNTITWAVQRDVQSIGMAKVDPRSGEILKSDIIMSDGWVRAYLSDLNLEAPEVTHQTQRGYFREIHSIPNSSTGEFAKKFGGHLFDGHLKEKLDKMAVLLKKPSRLIGFDNIDDKKWEDIVYQGLREIVMHETGHILGLRHNFKGSMGVSFECTLSRDCVAVHGTAASVMDYTPMNVPSTGVDDVYLFSPVIGAFDKLAIEYGYADAPSEASQEMPKVPKELQKILREAETYPVCTDGDRQMGQDPTCDTYDFTSDPIRYYEDQLALFAKIQKHLLDAAVAPGDSYYHYGEAVEDLWYKVRSIESKLSGWIGGFNTSYSHRSSGGANVEATRPISPLVQKRMMDVANMILHPRTSGLLPKLEDQRFMVERLSSSWNGIEAVDSENLARSIREQLIGSLLKESGLERMEMLEGLGGMSVSSYLKIVTNAAFSPDGETLATADASEWDLQRLTVNRLGILLNDPKISARLAAHVSICMSEVERSVDAALQLVLLSVDAGGASPPTKQPVPLVMADGGLGNSMAGSEELRVVHLQRMQHDLARALEHSGAKMEKSAARSAAVTGVQPASWYILLVSCIWIGASSLL